MVLLWLDFGKENLEFLDEVVPRSRLRATATVLERRSGMVWLKTCSMLIFRSRGGGRRKIKRSTIRSRLLEMGDEGKRRVKLVVKFGNQG